MVALSPRRARPRATLPYCLRGGYCSLSGPNGVLKSYCLGYCKLIFAPPEKVVSCTVSTPPLDVPGGTSNDTTA